MSKRLEYTVKGSIIGALIDYALQVIFRLIFSSLRFTIRFWYVVIPLVTYLYIYHKVSYWWNNEAERDTILASFQKDRVSLTSPRAVMTAGGIRFIEFDVVNSANARIYRVSATCTYEPDELREDDHKTDSIYTEHAYAGHVAPGETRRVRLPLVPDGYLWQAKSDQLVNLRCEPRFEYERDDLFQGEMKKWRLSSQMDGHISHEVIPANRYGESVYLNLTGTLRNNSAETIGLVAIRCEMTSMFGFTDIYGKRFDNLQLKPGEALSLKSRVTKLSGKPAAALCRLERVEKV